MATKERMVTRRVIKSKTYDVYALENGQMRKLDTITEQGRISEKALAAHYKVDKVVTICIKEVRAIYGVPVSKFMELAVEVSETENEENEENE